MPSQLPPTLNSVLFMALPDIGGSFPPKMGECGTSLPCQTGNGLLCSFQVLLSARVKGTAQTCQLQWACILTPHNSLLTSHTRRWRTVSKRPDRPNNVACATRTHPAHKLTYRWHVLAASMVCMLLRLPAALLPGHHALWMCDKCPQMVPPRHVVSC